MPILRGLITPHPPIIIPEVGGRETDKVRPTIEGMNELAALTGELAPEVVIIISPHGTVFRDAVAVTTDEHLSGDLAQFGASLQFEFANDTELGRELVREAKSQGIGVVALDQGTAGRYRVSTRLDHGMTVPLYFLRGGNRDFRLLPLAFGYLPFEELYRFGISIRVAVEKLGRRAVIVASGDLSHRLTPDAPAGFNPQGQEFDNLLVDLLKKGDVPGILGIRGELEEAAGECGLRSFIIMLGALDGLQFDVRILSYEGPFGVGYLVADAVPGEADPQRRHLEMFLANRRQDQEKRRGLESVPVALARTTLESYVQTGQVGEVPVKLDDILRQQAGVFVSLKKNGQLRGCIGTIAPTQANAAEEIIQNAISAGTRDPRFAPVEAKELENLVYSVDILYPPEPITGFDQLDPQKYGVIVRSGHKSGLLLPNLEGVDTVQEQVEIARQKAGIRQNEPVQLERFQVVRYY